MKKTKIVRQGDVFLLRVSPKPSDLEADTTTDPRGIVLAEGETSNHWHGVFGNGAKLFRYKATGQRVLVVAKDGANLRVVGGESGGLPRHLPIQVSPGKYEVRIQRQFDSGYSRQVAD